MSTYKITFITPLFSRGAYDSPEIRPPSIRGQLHWWFRALDGSYADEKAIFGGVHGVQKDAVASKIVIRVSDVDGKTDSYNTLPHKNGGAAAPKPAYCVGSSFTLHVLTRLGGLEGGLKSKFEKALHTWLMLGTLGLRSTRAAGSFIWEPLDGGFACPQTFEEYESQCQTLLNGVPTLKFALLKTEYTSAEKARVDISDTLGGMNKNTRLLEDQDELSVLSYPLGNVYQRGQPETAPKRKTSPLRFRIVKCGNDYRIAAVWDNRREVTGNTERDLQGIIRLLREKDKALGILLENSNLI